jgi:hypothetical protein
MSRPAIATGVAVTNRGRSKRPQRTIGNFIFIAKVRLMSIVNDSITNFLNWWRSNILEK